MIHVYVLTHLHFDSDQQWNNIICQIFHFLGSVSSQDSIGNIPPSDYTPPGSLSSHTSIHRTGSEEFPAPPSEVFFQHRHSSGSFPPVTPPPDLTRQSPADKFTDTKGSRVMHLSSVRTIEEDDGQESGEVTLYRGETGGGNPGSMREVQCTWETGQERARSRIPKMANQETGNFFLQNCTIFCNRKSTRRESQREEAGTGSTVKVQEMESSNSPLSPPPYTEFDIFIILVIQCQTSEYLGLIAAVYM